VKWHWNGRIQPVSTVGTFGREVMPLNDTLEFIATEGFFWIHAS